jgi:hypothetical protein
MTQFAETLRHYCRNPRCRMKLKAPVENPHKAFCTPGCRSSFYLKRCLVCENEKPPGSRPDRKLCRRPKCKTEYAGNKHRFEPFDAKPVPDINGAAVSSRSAHLAGIKSDGSGGRAWRIVAGQELTPSQFHCATVPDGPDGKWKDGAPGFDLPLLGGGLTEPKWREVISPDGVKCFVTRFRDAQMDGAPSDWRPSWQSHWQSSADDDLSIPDFLKR